MSKHASKKSSKYTKIRNVIGTLHDTSEGGDIVIDVSVRRFIAIDIDGVDYPQELNAWEARRLGHALLKAADKLDGAR